MAQAAQGEPNRFITLSSRYRPDEMTPDQAAQQLVHAWRMVVQRGKREGIFKEIQYIAVFELTKKGWPHLHILARCDYIIQRWLSLRMEEYAESPVVDVRKVKSRRRAAWYVAKYTAKAPEKFLGCKRYWRTHGYDLSPNKRDKPLHDHFKGYFYEFNIFHTAALYEAHDYSLLWTSEHSLIAVPSGIDLYATARAEYLHPPPATYKDHRPWNSDSKARTSTSTDSLSA